MADLFGCAFFLFTGLCAFLPFGFLSGVVIERGDALRWLPLASGGAVAGVLALLLALLLPRRYNVPIWIGLPVVPLAELICRVSVEGGTWPAGWPVEDYWMVLSFLQLPVVLCAIVIARLRRGQMRWR
ncbi:MAG: hypothetical protein ACOYN0_19650 [Phycisphaerales bacterium]